MDPNPTDVKLDMLRSKTSYWYNEMYVKINIAFGIIGWMILKQNPTEHSLGSSVRLTKSYWYLSIYNKKLNILFILWIIGKKMKILWLILW